MTRRATDRQTRQFVSKAARNNNTAGFVVSEGKKIIIMDNEFSQQAIVSDKLVLPRSSQHKFYVKRSKIKHVLFALFVVALLIFASLFFNAS